MRERPKSYRIAGLELFPRGAGSQKDPATSWWKVFLVGGNEKGRSGQNTLAAKVTRTLTRTDTMNLTHSKTKCLSIKPDTPAPQHEGEETGKTGWQPRSVAEFRERTDHLTRLASETELNESQEVAEQ